MSMLSLVAPACPQAEPEQPRQLVVQVVTAVHFGQFTLTLPVEHWCDAPAHDKIRWNGQRQQLDQSPGHAHAKSGGSSLPAGRARATKATGSPSGHSSSLWPIQTNFAGRALVWRAGPRQDTIKRTTPAPKPLPWPWACQVWWLQLVCRPSQSDQGNWWSKWSQQFTLAN